MDMDNPYLTNPLYICFYPQIQGENMIWKKNDRDLSMKNI